MKSKRAMVESTLGKIILALVVLVVIIFILTLMKGKMSTLWQKIALLLRFG